jgi:hypothetical protein
MQHLTIVSLFNSFYSKEFIFVSSKYQKLAVSLDFSPVFKIQLLFLNSDKNQRATAKLKKFL